MRLPVFAVKYYGSFPIETKRLGRVDFDEHNCISARKYNELHREARKAFKLHNNECIKLETLVLQSTFNGYPAEGYVKFDYMEGVNDGKLLS